MLELGEDAEDEHLDLRGELLAAARASGAKVVLAGDDRQLASIERGGLFTELKARHGAAEIVQVTRQRVDWQRGAVAVSGTLDSGHAFSVNAARALISVPLGVLQAGALEFSPMPGDILAQAGRLKMGPVLRQTLVFRSRFWSTLRPDFARLSFLFTPGTLPATWWTPMPDEAPVITAWIGGPAVATFQNAVGTGGGPNARLDRTLHTLATAFGLSPDYIREQLLSWHTHGWQADPYARGAYSYAPAGAIDASARMTPPVEQTLYFAGEHTDVTGHWGTVHGALRSGMRAATQIRADRDLRADG